MTTRITIQVHKGAGPASEVYSFDNPNEINIGYLRDNHIWIPSEKLSAAQPLLNKSSRPSEYEFFIPSNCNGSLQKSAERISLSAIQELHLSEKSRDQRHYFHVQAGSSIEFACTPYRIHIQIKDIDKSLSLPKVKPALKTLFQGLSLVWFIALILSIALHFGLLKVIQFVPSMDTHDYISAAAHKFHRIDVKDVQRLTKLRSLETTHETAQSNQESQGETPKKAGSETKRQRPAQDSFLAATKTLMEPSESLSSALGNFGKKVHRAKPNNGSFTALLAEGVLPGGNSLTSRTPSKLAVSLPSNLGGSASKKLSAEIKGPERSAIVAEAKPNGGRIESDVLYRFLSARSGQLQACYEKALEGQRGLTGRATVEVTIEADGSASNTAVDSSDIRDPGLRSCIQSRIASWTFPKPTGGKVTVRFPLIFASAGTG